jgi:hypothetical protein
MLMQLVPSVAKTSFLRATFSLNCRHHSRHYDDDDYRPRSRNSSYYNERDDYYSRRPRRRDDYGDYGPPGDYRYARHAPPLGFTDPLAARGPYATVPQSWAPYTPANPQQAMFRSCLDRFRLESPLLYREWYVKYTAHLQNPAKFPVPPLPAQYAPPPAAALSAAGTGSLPRQPSVGGGSEKQRPPSGQLTVLCGCMLDFKVDTLDLCANSNIEYRRSQLSCR